MIRIQHNNDMFVSIYIFSFTNMNFSLLKNLGHRHKYDKYVLKYNAYQFYTKKKLKINKFIYKFIGSKDQ